MVLQPARELALYIPLKESHMTTTGNKQKGKSSADIDPGSLKSESNLVLRSGANLTKECIQETSCTDIPQAAQ